jgi:hypothetical protein
MGRDKLSIQYKPDMWKRQLMVYVHQHDKAQEYSAKFSYAKF